jgi:anti-sigma factor RsiW
MIDPKTIELMNRVLDGAATEPERADLDRALTSSPEARVLYDEMGRLVRRLDSAPMADLPAGLHPRVVSAVDALGIRHAVPSSEEHGFFSWLRAAIAPQGLRYASTFGLGLAAGAVILAVVRPGTPVDPSQVSGTLATPAASGSMPVAVPEAGVSGSVAVVDRGPVTQVRLKVDADGGTEWVFDVPDRAEPTQSVVLRVVKSGETVFEGAVHPVEP